MKEAITILFMFIGTFFIIMAAIGMLRMPDILLRMSVTTKAATLGIGTIFLAMIIHFSGQGSVSQGVTSRAVATIAFVFITAPVSAHMIGRAAYNSRRTRLWSGIVLDEYKGRFDPKAQASPEAAAEPPSELRATLVAQPGATAASPPLVSNDNDEDLEEELR